MKTSWSKLLLAGVLLLHTLYGVESKRKQAKDSRGTGGNVPPKATSETDHYKVLGLKRTASVKDIKKKYRSLAKKWHPDKNVGNEDVAKEKFMKVAKAYEILGDDGMRKIYVSTCSLCLHYWLSRNLQSTSSVYQWELRTCLSFITSPPEPTLTGFLRQ
jgi:hypothetical protein